MHSDRIQLGDKVRRRNDVGMDVPGAVMRLNDVAALIFWPQDNFYEIVPVADLELYDSIHELAVA